MKKTKVIVAIAVAIVLSLATGFVKAAQIQYNVSYTKGSGDTVNVRMVFPNGVPQGLSENISNAWTVQNSTTITRELSQGGYAYITYTRDSETQYFVACAPIELNLNESMGCMNGVTNYASSNSSVAKIEDGRIKAIKAGTAVITAKTKASNNDDIDLRWDLTVLAGDNSTDNPGSDEGGENPGDNSGDNQGDNQGENPGDSQGDNQGDNSGDNQGDNQGDNSGDNQGDSQGDNSGDSQGDNHGDNTGDNQGDNQSEEIKWTDGSKIKITTNQEKTKFNIYSVNTDYKYTDSDIGRYFLYISKNANENITSVTDLAGKEYTSMSANKDGYLTASIGSNLAELPGDNYAYIIEQIKEGINGGKSKLIVKARKLDDCQLLGLGQRLDIWLFNPNKTSVSNLIGASKDRKIQYKVGRVTSNDILKSLKEESSDISFGKLLKYAKEEKELKSGTIGFDGLDKNIISDLDIANNGYYFVYMFIPSEDGKYNEIEDVAVYQAIVNNGEKTMVHFEFASINVSDDTVSKDDKKSETEKKESKKDESTAKTKLPNTGVNTTVMIVILSVAIAGTVGFVGYRKYHIIK